jgi:membrane-bound lytic murein transglycosylase B
LFQTMGPPPEVPPHNDFDNVRTLLRKPMRYYITAGRQNEEVAADSTFATLLLRGLRGGADYFHDGIISADELGSYLYHEVPNYSPRPQTPQFKSIGNAKLSEGQFYFLTAPAHPVPVPQPAPAPAPQAAPADSAVTVGAAQCGSTAVGFEAWKKQFADEARGRGVSASTVAALMATNYATATIAADRGQRSFRLSLDQFLAERGGSAIAARGRGLKQSDAALFASIQQRYGVPPGPLIAIWGMETDFGRERGNQNTLSAVATLAYDCRRSAYFTDQLYATLTLIDRGILSAGTLGFMHGEIGQTQFLPKTILNYGTGGNLDNAANALASTANFLRAHGWQEGAGYQPGETNFGPLQAWNAAPVYQRAIALVGQQIDGGEGTPGRR